MDNENNNKNENADAKESSCCGDCQKRTCGEKNVFAETMKEGLDRMFGGMKSMSVALIAAVCMLSGCDKLPTAEKIASVSRLAGVSASMVVNLTKVDEKSKAVIVEILDKVEMTVPQTNQTFSEVWTPIAKEHVDKLVTAGKVSEVQGNLIMTGFTIACDGLDYVFDVRYPKAREYKELVEAAVHGFVGGYKSTSGGDAVKSSTGEAECDKEVYDYLKEKSGL